MIAYFRYARHADIASLETTGLWVVIGDLGLPHSAYAVLMQWCGEEAPL